MKIVNMKKCLSDHSDRYFFCIKSIFIMQFILNYKILKEENDMKLTMELSKRNTERLKKALEATDKKAVRELIGDALDRHYGFCCEIGRQQSSYFLNDSGTRCFIYVFIGVARYNISMMPAARLAIYYGTDDYEIVTRSEIDPTEMFDEIVLKEGTSNELRLKIKLAE